MKVDACLNPISREVFNLGRGKGKVFNPLRRPRAKNHYIDSAPLSSYAIQEKLSLFQLERLPETLIFASVVEQTSLDCTGEELGSDHLCFGPLEGWLQSLLKIGY